MQEHHSEHHPDSDVTASDWWDLCVGDVLYTRMQTKFDHEVNTNTTPQDVDLINPDHYSMNEEAIVKFLLKHKFSDEHSCLSTDLVSTNKGLMFHTKYFKCDELKGERIGREFQIFHRLAFTWAELAVLGMWPIVGSYGTIAEMTIKAHSCKGLCSYCEEILEIDSPPSLPS